MDDYYCFVDFQLLKNMVSALKCPECSGDVLLIDKLSLRMGFSHLFEIECQACQWRNSSYTSKECRYGDADKKTSGRNMFESNVRVAVGFREIGRGYAAINNFARCMNIHSFAENAFENLNSKLCKAYKSSAEKSMKRSAESMQDNENNEPTRKRVKIDGDWRKRGHASLNGFTSAVVDDKCVNVEVFSKFCRGCKMWERCKGSQQYELWKATHICSVNHVKSSGAMESAGAVNMFKRSVDKNNMIYQYYLGDGDTSSFKSVLDSDPYANFRMKPEKLECIGHAQKRMGTRLRNIVKSYKGTKTPLHGKNRLTESIINSMQNFYGLAIRKNTDSLYAMKKATGAILYHCTDFQDAEFRHQLCPRTEETWCKWQYDKLKGTSKYKNSISIPKWIYDIVKPIFTQLSSDELLSKCLHGETQNTNESFNAVVWSRCPKSVFVTKSTFEMAIHSAVMHFNDGTKGVMNVLSSFGIAGKVTCAKSRLHNINRVKQMNKKSSKPVKKRRKTLRSIKKGHQDKEDEKQTPTYVAGGF